MFGGDPEAFVISSSTGEVVSAHHLGLQHKKISTEGWLGRAWNTHVSRDGLLLEVNCAPVSCRANFGRGFYEDMHTYEVAILRQKGLTLKFVSSLLVPEQVLMTAPLDARTLGCDPSLNAYGPRDIPEEARHSFWRYAGGHIHVSHQLYNYNAIPGEYFTLPQRLQMDTTLAADLTRAFDLYAMLPATILRQSPAIFKRREVYGRAGEYRIQPHGLEYRTPGAELWAPGEFWLLSMVLGSIRYVMYNFPKVRPKLDSVNWAAVQATINTGDTMGYAELQSVPNIYTPDVILRAARMIEQENRFPFTQYSYPTDLHEIGSWAGVIRSALPEFNNVVVSV